MDGRCNVLVFVCSSVFRLVCTFVSIADDTSVVCLFPWFLMNSAFLNEVCCFLRNCPVPVNSVRFHSICTTLLLGGNG